MAELYMPSEVSARDGTRTALGASYFATFAALGVYGPLLALYLAHRDFSPFEVASLLAALPVLRILAAPAWTFLADIRRSSAWVLRLVAALALLSWALLEVARTPAAIVAALALFTIFRAPATSLLDVLALAWTVRARRPFGPLRAWGTAGYTASAFGIGVVVTRFGPDAIVHVSVALLAFTAVASLFLPNAKAPAREPLGPALRLLVTRPRFALFLATAILHQVGLASYDALFPAYLSGLSTPTYAGAAVGVGAVAEVLFMANSARVFDKLSHARILALAYAGSAVRWLIMATVTTPAILVAAQGLHAASFGAFYLASVAFVNDESPERVRASAQGIFQASTWGIGVALCLTLAAFVQAHAGLRALFLVGTVASTLGALLAILLDRMPSPSATR